MRPYGGSTSRHGVVVESLETWREAERLLTDLPDGSLDRQTVAVAVSAMHEAYLRVSTESEVPADLVDRTSERVGVARSVLEEIRGRLPQSAAETRGGGFAEELAAERRGWHELIGLVASLTSEECVMPGYYRNPDWSVRDVMAHLGTWLAEAEVQFLQMGAGTYEGHDVDVEALNAQFLAAVAGQPWDVARVLAHSGRTRMLEEWSHLPTRTDEASWWLRKCGPDHYAEHVPRLREWCQELIRHRTGAIVSGPSQEPPRDQPFWLDLSPDLTEDDARDFAQGDDVRQGARPILRPPHRQASRPPRSPPVDEARRQCESD